MSAAVAWDLSLEGAGRPPAVRLVPTGPRRPPRPDAPEPPGPAGGDRRRARRRPDRDRGPRRRVGRRRAGAAHRHGQLGQTLSEVAAEQLPDLPLAEGVARLQLANHLSSTQVHAGQTLLIPAAG